MRSLLILFFVSFTLWGFGQNQSTNDEIELEEEKSAPMPSSDALKKDRAKDREGAKGRSLKKLEAKPSNKVKNAYGYEMDIEDAEQSVQSPAYQNATINFEYSKRRSSVQRNQRSPSIQQQAEMNNAVQYFEENHPNSFEYNYFNYTAGNYDVSRYSNLMEAERLRPNNSDVHAQMSAYHVIKGNTAEAKKYMSKLVESGRLSNNVLDYAEDILLSAPQNGTLITHGFDDSYGAWYVQHSKGVRKDVQLVSLDFLQSDAYRDALRSKGYALPSSQVVNTEYFSEFCRLNKRKKLAVSLTTPKEYFRSILTSVYITGLVFEYREGEFDNFQRNVDLWENGLRKVAITSAKEQKVKKLSANYLPMLLQMRRVYNQVGNQEKVSELDATIDKVAVQCKKYDQVQGLKSKY